MKLEMHCPECRKPLAITLPDETPEAEASGLARLIVCETCGLRAATQLATMPPPAVGLKGIFFRNEIVKQQQRLAPQNHEINFPISAAIARKN